MQGITKKKTESIYEISLDAMKDMIADKLEVHPANINIRYVIEEVGADPMDQYPGSDEVTKIAVTVNE